MLILVLASALLICPQAAKSGAAGNAATAGAVRAAGTSPVPAAAPELVARAQDRLPRMLRRAPVLREGAMLTSVKGFFARSLAEPGLMVFALDEGFVSNVRRKLLVMPSDASDDVKALMDRVGGETPALYEVTGAVYDYRGRAFLLPSMVVVLRSPPPPGMLARVAPPDLAPLEERASDVLPPRIDAYLRTELPATSPLREIPATRLAHEPDPSLFPALDDGMAEELERRLEKGIARTGTGTTIQPAHDAPDRTLTLPAATRLQGRRAVVSRDPLTGVWRARMDTGRSGVGGSDAAEISMDLLPCRTLERMEKQVREQPIGTPWILSGEVVVSKDRNYLLLNRALPLVHSRFISP